MINKGIRQNSLEEEEKCQECGTILPNRKKEIREGGYFEFITECEECGTVYTD